MGRRSSEVVAKVRVFAYCRVSLDKQADQGFSLPAQVEKCRDYAKLYGHTIVDVVKETGSARNIKDRPLLLKVLEHLEKGMADGLLVVKLDRLTRSVKDIGELVSDGGPFAPGKARLFSVAEQIDTANASGRLVLNVLSSVSQWEREAIGERTSATMQHMKASGQYTGGFVPFGMRLERGELVPEKRERAAVLRAQQILKSQGDNINFNEVCRVLEAEGHLSRARTPFEPTQIRRIWQRR